MITYAAFHFLRSDLSPTRHSQIVAIGIMADVNKEYSLCFFVYPSTLYELFISKN